MKRIKPFDLISESASDTLVYRTKIATYSRSGTPTSIDFYNEPKSLYMARVTDGTAEWTMDLDYRNWGIDIGSNGKTKISHHDYRDGRSSHRRT